MYPTAPVPVFNLDYFMSLPIIPEQNKALVLKSQQILKALLLRHKGTDRLQRLLLCDLLESSLIRALDVLLVAPSYLTLSEPAEQKRFLLAYLCTVSLHWLEARAETSDEALALSKTHGHVTNL